MKDFLLSDDLFFQNGDFAIGESHHQHTEHIIMAQKGEYKETPEIGVGIEQMLNSDEPTEFLIEAKKNLEYDGQKVKNISFSEDGKINVDAKYKKE